MNGHDPEQFDFRKEIPAENAVFHVADVFKSINKKKKKPILGEFAVIWPRPLFGVNHEICLCVDSSQSLDVSTTVISTSVKCSCVSITSCKYLLIILEPSFNKL